MIRKIVDFIKYAMWIPAGLGMLLLTDLGSVPWFAWPIYIPLALMLLSLGIPGMIMVFLLKIDPSSSPPVEGPGCSCQLGWDECRTHHPEVHRDP